MSSVGCVSVTLTLGPLTGVNRRDRTSTSSYSTGMLHTHADAGKSDNSDADSFLKATDSVTAELLAADVALV